MTNKPLRKIELPSCVPSPKPESFKNSNSSRSRRSKRTMFQVTPKVMVPTTFSLRKANRELMGKRRAMKMKKAKLCPN